MTAIPVLPYVTDDTVNLERLVKTVAEAGADYLISDLLNFRGEARSRFMKFLANFNPELIPIYEKLYKTDYCEKDYRKKIRKQINPLIKEYNLDKYDLMFSYRKK